MLQVALGWELYERTHSALALGLVGLVTAIPVILLALPAGHLADKMDRKKIVIGSQMLFVAMSVALAIALWRCPRDAGGFAAGLAVVYLPFIAFNKQAFANYYLFVIGALCCAVAAAPVPAIARKSEEPLVR
jgi:MFS family permease